MDVNTTGEITETVDAAPEMDMDAAVADISEDLGLVEDSGDSGDSDSTEAKSETSTQKPDEKAEKSAKTSETSEERSDEKSSDTESTTSDSKPAPRTWRAEAAAEWDKLSPTVQAEILKREEDVFKGIESYKADANFGKMMATAVKPFASVMQQYGVNPAQQVNALLNAHYTLALGSPAEKMAILNRMITDYKIDVNAEAPYVDPEVKALREELRTLKSSVQGVNQQREAEVRNGLMQQIETFSKDPAHADFDLVANDIAALLQSGRADSLQAAYDQAIWLNPVTRAKQLERETNAKAAQAKKETEARIAAAKKATAANVTTRPKSASAAAPLGSMDDTLEAVLANIKSRS